MSRDQVHRATLVVLAGSTADVMTTKEFMTRVRRKQQTAGSQAA